MIIRVVKPKTREGERVPFVLTYHPALNGLGKAAGKLQSMLSHSDEHRKVFPAPPIIAFRRCKNLKDILVRARLSKIGDKGAHIIRDVLVVVKLVVKCVMS